MQALIEIQAPYQPVVQLPGIIVSRVGDEIYGLEASLRWVLGGILV
jgi:hypothetical protein